MQIVLSISYTYESIARYPKGYIAFCVLIFEDV